MSFEVDRYSSSWAHIALCADLTWATEPPDDFIIANQRLWAQHCRVSQVLQDATDAQPSQSSNQCEQAEKRSTSGESQENGGCSRKTVKDVIPESRLAQFYGNFYYDETREKCYANANEKSTWRGYNGQGCENSDLTECWMLPEVEYWFRKLLDDAPERTSSRRRQRVPSEDFRFETSDYIQASERWGPCDGRAEAALSARVLAVRALWAPSPAPAPAPPEPPPAPRKMRARRRQPRRLTPRAPLPAYCLAPALLCDPKCKFEAPPSPLCQRACRLPALCRAAPYRGTAVCRYAPTNRRLPERRLLQKDSPKQQVRPAELKEKKEDTQETKPEVEIKEKVLEDQQPTTSAAAIEGLRKKRLYSTVLSMSAPSTINLQNCVRLQKFTPGLLKLNPKIIPVIRENKFEELEKEALEQYKASDESIDTKFKELEKQAEEQYSTSNSNTSCSSGEKKTPADDQKHAAKFRKEKVDSVMIYSQNFPDLNSKTASVTNLKNFHTPPRGEKKEHQQHRPNKRSVKSENQRAASDTDYEGREDKSRKSSRWTLHIVPKKRHMTVCASDFSSDEEMEDTSRSIKDAGPCMKHLGMHSAHGGGDLIMRKT